MIETARRCALLLVFGCAAAAAEPPWIVAGSQGLVRMVIVPPEQAGDREAYARHIAALCEPERTCFLNFYTNTGNAPLAVPLPDAIGEQATALFRRSSKNGVETFQWSCRMRKPEPPCF